MILFPKPDMTLSEIVGAYLTSPFELSPSGHTLDKSTINPTYVTEYAHGAFKRLWVNNHFKNGLTTVFWELNRGFADPGPYSFQLQFSNSGTPRGDDWQNIGSSTSGFFAIDDLNGNHQRMFGKTITVYYRVVLTTPTNAYMSQIIWASEYYNKHDWLIIREILRSEQLAHRIFSSEKGYLLKARRYGPLCEDCRDTSVAGQFPNTITDSNCKTCYGTGFISGYYPPTEYYALMQPSSAREARELEQVGTIKQQTTQARFLGTLQIVQADAWISDGSDERFYIHNVKEAAVWKGTPIVFIAEMRQAPFTDAIYDIPIT